MALTNGLASLRSVGSSTRFDWKDPNSVLSELERLKQRQREINMGANPAFGGTGGMGTSSFASSPMMAKAGGNTNVEFWENNDRIRTLEDLAGGGVGSSFRTKRPPEVVGPGGESKESVEYRNARMAAAGDQGGGSSPMSALRQYSSQGGGGGLTDKDLEARLAVAGVREAEAKAAGAEAATPVGQAQTRERAMNENIANIRTGRAGYVAGGKQDIETGVAGQQAASEREIAQKKTLSEADTYFLDPVDVQRKVQQGLDLEKIRATKVEPAAMTAEGRAAAEAIKQRGLGERGDVEAQNKMLVALLNDYTRMSTSMSLGPEDRARAVEGANALKAYLQSLGVNLTGGTPAPGPPIR